MMFGFNVNDDLGEWVCIYLGFVCRCVDQINKVYLLDVVQVIGKDKEWVVQFVFMNVMLVIVEVIVFLLFGMCG